MMMADHQVVLLGSAAALMALGYAVLLIAFVLEDEPAESRLIASGGCAVLVLALAAFVASLF
jgi:hypothetical protein